MFHPVGSQPPAVYWRRRIMVLGVVAAVILVVLTVVVLSNNSSATPGGAAAPSSSRPDSVTATNPVATSTPTPTQSITASPTGSSGRPPSSSHVSVSSVAPVACLPAQLTVRAGALAASYKVGQQPALLLQVTNNGSLNCTENLADSQVELRVYNGAARVWGSHDCHIEPGTSVRTLVAGTTVGIQVTWSGLSSQPKCAGTRQRVGAGTYTVYAYLAGQQGTPAQFSMS
jgi:hypothetical protein